MKYIPEILFKPFLSLPKGKPAQIIFHTDGTENPEGWKIEVHRFEPVPEDAKLIDLEALTQQAKKQ